MVRQALELQRDPADRLSARRLPAPREGFGRAAVRLRVPHDGVSRDRLGDQHAALAVRALEQSLHAPVLVAEHDLEEQHLLAVRLKPEVPRLDDAGVHRADRDLVHLVARDPEERVRLAVHRPRPATRRQVILRMPAQRLEPGMALRHDAALLGDLALEQVCLRAGRRERRVALPDEGARGAELAPSVIGEHGDEARLVVPLRHAEERNDAPARHDRSRDRGAEALDGFARDGRPRDRPPVAKPRPQLVERGHGAAPPSAAAAAVPVASTTFPTARKRSPFTSALLIRWSTLPYTPTPPRPRPRTSRPACSTLE